MNEVEELRRQIAALTAQLAQYQQAEEAAEGGLKSCPFCSCADIACTKSEQINEWWVYCRGCGAEVPMMRDLKMAHLAWNRRATPQAVAVAVVLPDTRSYPNDDFDTPGEVDSHNSCLAEVRRLNVKTTTVQELARLRGCEQDAARYRKLRAMHWTDKILTVAHPKYVSLGAQTYSGDMLDAAIDAIRTNGENDE